MNAAKESASDSSPEPRSWYSREARNGERCNEVAVREGHSCDGHSGPAAPCEYDRINSLGGFDVRGNGIR